MTIDYLDGRPWSDWTREERFFCSVLYHRAIADKQAFAEWLIEAAGLPLSCQRSEWELGYEVCFYRDYLERLLSEKARKLGIRPSQIRAESARGQGLPFKRTFDLCLFGPGIIIIVEAKCHEGFTADQNEAFNEDKKYIRRLPMLANAEVHVVALASSRYLQNAEISTWKSNPFSGRPVSWAQVHARYGDDAFRRADELYPGAQDATVER